MENKPYDNKQVLILGLFFQFLLNNYQNHLFITNRFQFVIQILNYEKYRIKEFWKS
jgi:hypothetical protein